MTMKVALPQSPFKGIHPGAIAITPGSASLNVVSAEVPPSPEPAASAPLETLPAATLPVVCRAARATNVLSWSLANRILKRMPRMTALERTRVVVDLMDKMRAMVGADAMTAAMQANGEMPNP
jgi:hypothetical protein